MVRASGRVPERRSEPRKPTVPIIDKISNMGEGRKLKRLEELARLVTTYEPAEIGGRTGSVLEASHDRREARAPLSESPGPRCERNAHGRSQEQTTCRPADVRRLGRGYFAATRNHGVTRHGTDKFTTPAA